MARTIALVNSKASTQDYKARQRRTLLQRKYAPKDHGYYQSLTVEDIEWLSVPHNRGKRMGCLTLRGGQFSTKIVRLNADRIHHSLGNQELTEAQWDQLIVQWPRSLIALTLYMTSENPALPPTCPRGPENKVYFGQYGGFQLRVYWQEWGKTVTIERQE